MESAEILKIADMIQAALGTPPERKKALIERVLDAPEAMKHLASSLDPKRASIIRLTKRAKAQRLERASDTPTEMALPFVYPGTFSLLVDVPELMHEIDEGKKVAKVLED